MPNISDDMKRKIEAATWMSIPEALTTLAEWDVGPVDLNLVISLCEEEATPSTIPWSKVWKRYEEI